MSAQAGRVRLECPPSQMWSIDVEACAGVYRRRPKRSRMLMLTFYIMQDVAWGGVLLSHGGSWARSLPKADLWPLVVLPPIVGALAHILSEV